MQYKELFEKSLDEINEDIFFRADNFKEENWYGDLLLYERIGVCSPQKEDIEQLQKALKILGYRTKIKSREGKIFIVPDNRKPKNIDFER